MVDTSGLATIPLRGGPPKEVLKVDSDKGERQPQSPYALPGANAVLLTMTNADTETFHDAKIVAFVPRTGEKRTLVEGGANPRYSRSGHLVFARDGKLLAVRFDPTALKVSGQPAVVVEGVHNPATPSQRQHATVIAKGHLYESNGPAVMVVCPTSMG